MSDNKVTLLVNGSSVYEHWIDCSITSELSALARSFSVTITANLPQGKSILQQFHLGDTVQVMIGADVVCTGYIEALPVSYDANSVSASISGRSKTCDLVDCSVCPPGRAITMSTSGGWSSKLKPEKGRIVPAPAVSAISWRQQKLETIIAQMAAPFDIKFVVENGSLSEVRDHDCDPTQTVLENLKNLVQKDDLFLMDTPQGNLTVVQKGSKTATDMLVLGKNVLSGSASFDGSKLYSEYRTLGQGSGTDTKTGKAVSTYNASCTNTLVPRFRIKTTDNKGQGSNPSCQRQSDGDMLFDAMQFYRTSYSVQGWRQSDGSLWEVNSLVKVTDELLGLEMMTMLITKVIYTINEGGLITQLECVPPDGFRAETSPSSENKGWKGKSGKAKTSKETSKDLSFIKGKNE